MIPDNLIDKYEEWIKYSYYTSYYMPSLVSQATFESYIKSNIYEKHIKIIDKHLKELLSTEILRQYFINHPQSIDKYTFLQNSAFTHWVKEKCSKMC